MAGTKRAKSKVSTGIETAVTNGLRSRIVGHDRVSADELLANPFNHRRHGKRQQKVVSASLDELGVVKSVQVNRTTGHILDGHERIRDAKSRGAGTLIDVEYVELSEEEERKALLILDASVGLATIDADAMDELLEEVQTSSKDMLRWFDQLEDGIANKVTKVDRSDIDAPAKVDQKAELRLKWGTAPGDLWGLGDHRLICGDCTDGTVVARLFAGQVPGGMMTDPLYGVQYDPAWRNVAGVSSTKRLGKVANDHRSSWARAWMHFPGDVAYVWHAGAYATDVDLSLQSVKFKVHAQIIWVKHRAVMSRCHYHWRHEPCFYVVREGATAAWSSDRRQNTVWADIVDSWRTDDKLFATQVDAETILAFPADATTVWEIKPNGDQDRATVHGTQKPVECHARGMRHHSHGIWYDPFGGSGTGIIAAEQEEKQMLMVELDPDYVAVILERYENATGVKPVRLE